MALLSSLRKAALKDMDARTVELTELKEQLTVEDAKMSELCAKNSTLPDKLSQLKTQNVAGIPNRTIRNQVMIIKSVRLNVQRYHVLAKIRLLRHLQWRSRHCRLYGKTTKIVSKR